MLASVAFVAPLPAQTPIDSAIYRYVRSVKAIDNHTHIGLPVLPGQPADSDYDALPVGEAQDGVRGELGSVVGDDNAWSAAPPYQAGQLSRYTVT